ncbi:MAG: S8 family serine peptidase [Gemmatimonadaceae bacterium]|nr:S8 family serine peptidase [Gemmatimonadaceae bacterium]
MANQDPGSRKLHPRLRTVINGDRGVNARRSLGSATVACGTPVEEDEAPVTAMYDQIAQQSITNLQAAVRPMRTLKRSKRAQRPKLTELSKADDSFVNVFVEFYPDRARVSPEEQRAAVTAVAERIERWTYEAGRGSVDGGVLPRRNIVCATVPISRLDELNADPAVAFVHPADPLKLDLPTATAASRKPRSKAVGTPQIHGRGDGLIIGIIDVGGFDFSHPDFLNADGTTRFVTIWDQGGDFRRSPAGFDYGAEFTQSQLNNALLSAAKPGMPGAVMIERQSQREPSSHGTHVASIAAGNSGVCPNADIAAVLIDVPSPEDPLERRRATFSDTSRITHAVEYLLRIAEEKGKAIAINVSLGTNGGAHDGSSGVSRWLDAYLATPGRAICVAAGNAGQEAAQDEGDLGWIMGRIHTSGQIPARGLEIELEWTVVGNGIEDISENELEIWYGAQDRFTVAIKPPTADWIEVEPRQYVQNHRLESGTYLSIYNELYHPTNGANYIAIYLSPNQSSDLREFRGIQAGVWKIRLKGEEIRDGRFDAWIERDDPGEVGRDAGRRLFRFPSFFSQKSNVDSHSISSLACGNRVISAANLDEVRHRINASSSQGPTRDGRCKPEIAAPGTEVVAANGFAGPEEPWVAMTGTSMACPYVTGVLGLMLVANNEVTAAQCAGILQRTARPLAGSSYKWINDAGWGRIDGKAAIEEARSINERKQVRQKKA